MNDEYLNISIFYNQKNWHQLLTICLQPLFTKILQEGGVEYYFIYLNKERGDNVRITFIIEAGMAEQVIKILDIDINNFLIKCPSTECIHKNEGDEFFLDYQNNSIKCNLYNKRMSLSNDVFKQMIILRFFISKTIACCLSKEEIDGECSFVFSMYLLFTLIKVYSPSLNEAKNITKELLSALQVEVIDVDKQKRIAGQSEEFNELFEDNKETFTGICGDVWNLQDNMMAMPWLADWENLLINDTKKEHTLLLSYTFIYDILIEHLSLNSNNKDLSAEIILKTLDAVDSNYPM